MALESKLCKRLEESYVERLNEIRLNRDTETGHMEADDVLCDLLSELGFSRVVEVYRLVPKWFA